MTMQPRDYREAGNALSANLQTFLAAHPDAFDCLLFRAQEGAGETVAEPEEDVVGSIERNERAVTYADPVPARAVKIPDGIPLVATDDATEPDGTTDQPVILILGEIDVPRQSILQYNEYINRTGLRQVNVYVVKSEPMGSIPGAGLLRHYCIPFRGFDDVEGNKP